MTFGLSKTFFTAQGDNGFTVRVQLHAVIAGVTVADGLTQIGNAAGKGITVVYRLLGGLDKFFHNVGRRGNIRISHAEVHNINVLPPQPHFEVAHQRKHIGGQTANPREIFHVTGS